MTGIVEALKEDYEALLEFLLNQQPSMAIVMGSTLAKVLLLACASEVETDLQSIILNYFQKAVQDNPAALEFVRNKAIARQYHTFFDWEGANANKFFALFGQNFKSRVSALVKDDDSLSLSIRHFLELGSLRNQLVHQNYASFTLVKTADEVFELYRGAREFLLRLTDLLHSDLESHLAQSDLGT